MPIELAEPLALAGREALRVERLTIGGSPASIVDGVYADPEAVRALALGLAFDTRAGLYPGRLAFGVPAPRDLLELASDMLGVPLDWSKDYRRTTFAAVTTPPGELAPLQRQPHFDSFCDYAGVIYLGPREPRDGGTSFWRHRRTGLERAPRDDPRVGRMMLEGLTASAPGYPVDSSVHWERVMLVPMRFNRMLLYDARAFHSPHVTTLGDPGDPEQLRLTQNLFLDRAA